MTQLLSKRFAWQVANRLTLNFSTMVFLTVTGYFTWQSGTWPQLFSLRGLVFLLIGGFVSGSLIGALLTQSHRRWILWMVDREDGSLDHRLTLIIQHSGTLLMVCQLLLVYYLTQWAVVHWLLN